MDFCVLCVPWVSLARGALGGCPLGETCVVYVVVWGFFPVRCVGFSLCCVSLYSNVLLCLPCVCACCVLNVCVVCGVFNVWLDVLCVVCVLSVSSCLVSVACFGCAVLCAL